MAPKGTLLFIPVTIRLLYFPFLIFASFHKLTLFQGSLVGALTATVLVLWIGFGTQAAVAAGTLTYEERITSIEGCLCLNTTAIQNATAQTAKAMKRTGEKKDHLEV